MPSPEALPLAADAIQRRYLLPETTQHPVVKSECIWLAYLIQAYGQCLQGSVPHDEDINSHRLARSSEVVSGHTMLTPTLARLPRPQQESDNARRASTAHF
jgi:hypothetical protein